MSNNIKKEIDKIQIPKNLRERRQIGIQKASSEMHKSLKKNQLIKWISGVASVFILMLGFLLVSNSSLANSIKSYFKDITNNQGAVTGTEYTQASKDISVNILEPMTSTNTLVYPIVVTFQKADIPPYNVTEALTLGEYRIIDNSGTEISDKQIKIEFSSTADFSFEVSDKNKLLVEVPSQNANQRTFKANLIINKEFLNTSDKYTLKINSFTSHKKADAPLEIKGEWDIEIPNN